MVEDDVFAFSAPAPSTFVDRYSHLTQPASLVGTPWQDAYSHLNTNAARPMTAPSTYTTGPLTAPLYASQPPTQRVNLGELAFPSIGTTNPQPYYLPDEPQRPATSTGHSISPFYSTAPAAYPPAHFNGGYTMQPGVKTNVYPPQQQQLQHRPSNAQYSFSHDPFPLASTSNVSPAHMAGRHAAQASRPTTANTIRPDTAGSRTSTTSTLLDDASLNGSSATAIGPDGRVYQFVGLQQAQKKRARRRFDEVERMYDCNYSGCTKSYGCLNHLNAHVAAQKHGPKRLPSEFKEMRKEWRAKKKLNDAAKKQKPNNDSEHFEDGEGNSSDDHVVPSRRASYPMQLAIDGSANAFQYNAPIYSSHLNQFPLSDNATEALRPQTAPGAMDLFAFQPSSPIQPSSAVSSNSSQTNSDSSSPNSPFKSYSRDPSLSAAAATNIGLLGLPKRRGSLPVASLDGIPEAAALHQPLTYTSYPSSFSSINSFHQSQMPLNSSTSTALDWFQNGQSNHNAFHSLSPPQARPNTAGNTNSFPQSQVAL